MGNTNRIVGASALIDFDSGWTTLEGPLQCPSARIDPESRPLSSMERINRGQRASGTHRVNSAKSRPHPPALPPLAHPD